MGPPKAPKRCPVCGERYPDDYRVCPRDAVPLEDIPETSDDPLVGQILGDCYRIIRKIGLGGTARVYEARHTRLRNKRFAVKLLLPEFAVQPEIVLRFEREAEAASRIHHPNVLDVYDVHRTKEGAPYIVAEFLEGEELGEVLNRLGRLEAVRAVEIALQICDALAQAHASGVVHRDMKPENVFLMGDMDNPQAKVLDFGISKVAYETGATKLTKTGMVMGTPSYMPPEQAKGGKIDQRTDVYGVGAILYRAVTGRRPFEEEDAMSVLSAVLRFDPPRPRSVEPSIPEALELIIERAMAKDPDDRYPTIEALRDDLKDFLDVRGRRVIAPSQPSIAAGQSGRDPSLLPFQPMMPDLQRESALAQAARESKRARPSIVFLTVIGFFWLVTGVVELVHGIVKGIGLSYTRMEMWLGFGILMAAALTPGVFWIRYMVRRIWSHSNRALRLSYGMRRVVGFGVATYGTTLLLVRLFSIIGAPNPPPVPFSWTVLPFLASLLGSGIAWLLLWRDRQRTRQQHAEEASTKGIKETMVPVSSKTDPGHTASSNAAKREATENPTRAISRPPLPVSGVAAKPPKLPRGSGQA